MPRLAQWGREMWSTILADPEAREAVTRLERDALIVLRAAREALNTSRMLSLVSALGSAAKDIPSGE
jgi:hypothetical protein